MSAMSQPRSRAPPTARPKRAPLTSSAAPKCFPCAKSWKSFFRPSRAIACWYRCHSAWRNGRRSSCNLHLAPSNSLPIRSNFCAATMSCPHPQRKLGSRSKASALYRIRLRRSCRNISGASVRLASFPTMARRVLSIGAPPHHEERLPPQRERDQTERADNNTPPCKHDKAVAADIIEESLHHDQSGDERHNEADRDNAQVIGGHFGAVFVKIIGEGTDHGRNRQKEREFRRRALIGP